MVKREVITKRLQKLETYLDELKSLSKSTEHELFSDIRNYRACERSLYLAIESCSDIGGHIVTNHLKKSFNSYSDIPKVFFEEKLISENLLDIWIQMIGLRNILSHDYVNINQKKVYALITNSLGDFDKLKELFIKFI